MINHNFLGSIVIDSFFIVVNILLHFLLLFLQLVIFHFLIILKWRLSIHLFLQLQHFLNEFLRLIPILIFILLLFRIVSFLCFFFFSHCANSSSLRDRNTGVLLNELSCIIFRSQNAMGLHVRCFYLSVISVSFNLILVFKEIVAV